MSYGRALDLIFVQDKLLLAIISTHGQWTSEASSVATGKKRRCSRVPQKLLPEEDSAVTQNDKQHLSCPSSSARLACLLSLLNPLFALRVFLSFLLVRVLSCKEEEVKSDTRGDLISSSPAVPLAEKVLEEQKRSLSRTLSHSSAVSDSREQQETDSDRILVCLVLILSLVSLLPVFMLSFSPAAHGSF